MIGNFKIGGGTGSSSALSVTNLHIGIQSGSTDTSRKAEGTFEIDGGTVNVGSGGIAMTITTGGIATLNVSGGTLTVGGNITSGGGTTTINLTGGILNLSGNAIGSGANPIGTLTFQSGTLENVASINGTGGLTKTTGGTLIITGANAFSGGLTVNGGAVNLNFAGSGAPASNLIASGNALTLGGALTVTGASATANAQTVASLATTTNTVSTLTLAPGASGGSTTLTISSSTFTPGAGSFLNFNYSAGTTNGTTVGNDIVAWNANLTSGLIDGGNYTVTDRGGSGFATVVSGNVVRLTDPNPGSNGLPVTTGAAGANYFINQNYSTSSTSTPGSLVEALSGAVAANTVTVDTTGLVSGANLFLGTNLLTITNGGGILFTGANPYTISGTAPGGIKASSAGGSLTLDNYNSSASGVNISAPILDNSTSALTVNGTGTTVLSGANTYAGATAINGGTLQIGAGGTTGSISTSSAVTDNGTLVFNRTDNYGGNFSNTISGSGAVTLAAGALTLTAANSFAGPTTVSAGALTVSGAGTLVNSASLTVNAGATFNYAPTTVGTTLTLGAGSTLNLANGSSIGLAWNTSTADVIKVLGAATVGTTGVGIDMTGSFTSVQAYIILQAGSGLNNGAYYILNPTNYTAVVAQNATSVTITPTTATALTTAFWTGGLTGATNVWAASNGSTASNWVATSGGAAQALVPGSAAAVTISNSSVTTAPSATVLGANMTINSLTIADTTNGLGLNADGNTLTITPSSSTTGITMNASVPASTIAVPIAQGAAQTWTNNSANLLTLSGGVSGAFNLTVAGTGNTTISGVIGTGAGTLTKNGAGTLTLSGANTYTGTTTVSAGTLQVTNTKGLGGTSGISFGSGNTATLTIDAPGALTTSAGGTFAAPINGAASTGGVYTINMDYSAASGAAFTQNFGTLAIGSSSTANLTTNAFNLTSGTGLISFTSASWSQANGNSGTITANLGVDILGNVTNSTTTASKPETLTLQGSATNSAIGGAISDGGGTGDTTTITKAGSGTWTLSGANTYTGTTTIEQGTLVAAAAAPSGANGAFGNATTSVALGDSTTISSAYSASLIIGGAFTVGRNIQVGSSASTQAGTYTIGGNTPNTSTFSGTETLDQSLSVTQTVGGALNLTGNITGGVTGNTYTVTFNNAGAVSQSAGVIGGGSGTIALTQAGSGATTLAGVNTYTGATSVGSGNLIIASTGALGNNSATTVSGGTLTIAAGSGGRTLSNSLILSGGTLKGGFQDNVGSGGAITLNGSSVMHTFTSTGTLAIPTASVTASGFLVGGGGGAGYKSGTSYGTAGGGGQVVPFSGSSIANGSTVTVGAGGTAAGPSGGIGGTGGPSSISGASLTAAGGKGGGTAVVGGASGSGNAGGSGNGTASGGGGGDSAAGGTAPSNSAGGAGGNGTFEALTGQYYGGGGGGGASTTGGAGGLGGGGVGWPLTTNGNAGTANTGGGAGGNGSTTAIGGSGIVVVQYAYNPYALASTLTLSGGISLGAGTTSTLDAYQTGDLIDITTNPITGSTGNLIIASSNSSGGTVRFSVANTYGGTTTINSGATLKTNIAAAIPSGSAVTVNTGGTLDVSSYIDTISSLSNSGVVDFGLAGDAPVLLTISNAFALGGTINVNSSGSQNLGLYKLAGYNSESGSYTQGTVPTGYKLVTNSTELDLQHLATIGTITAQSGLSIITGGSVPFTFTVGNSAPSSSANLGFSATAGSNVTGSIAGPVSVTAQITSGATSGLTFNGTTVGAAQTGGFTVSDPNSTNSSAGGTVTVNVYGHASPVSMPVTLALGNIHAGYSSPVNSSTNFTVANGSSGDYRVNLKGTASAGADNVSINNFGGLQPNGTAATLQATLATGVTGGTLLDQNITYTFADDSSLSGANASLATPSLAVTGQVYSGQMTWTGASGSDFGTGSNWNDTVGADATRVHVAPGLDTNFKTQDTATFGGTVGNYTVNLSGVAPSLNAVTFNSPGSFTIAQGSGSTGLTLAGTTPSITAAGTQTISAPVALAANANIAVTSSGDSLTVSGPITGSTYGVTKTGAGTLIVSGGISGSGVVNVSAGNLEADSAIVGEVTVGGSGELSGNGGTVGGITTDGGTVAPGLTVGSEAAGTLAVNGNVTLDGASNFNIRVGVTTANSGDNDQLAVNGSATLSGALNITLGAGTGLLTAGNSYSLTYIILAGGYSSATSNTFSSYTINGQPVTLGGPNGNTLSFGGISFEIEYGYNGTTFNDTLTSTGPDVALELTSVPEPGTWGMLLGGLATLIAIQRRRRNHNLG